MITWAIIGIAVAVPSAGAIWFIGCLCWMAKGEPDVNGDPERDSGSLKTPDCSDFILCEVICCKCGCHMVGPTTDPEGKPTTKVSDLCETCAGVDRQFDSWEVRNA